MVGLFSRDPIALALIKMGDLYAEMEEKWGKRAARGMKTCSRGRETLADGKTGSQLLREVVDDGPEAVFMRELAANRKSKDHMKREQRAHSAEGSRASQRRRKRAGNSVSPAPPSDRHGAAAAALKEQNGGSDAKPPRAAEARKVAAVGKEAKKAAATPRQSAQPAAKRSKKSPEVKAQSLFMTSPKSHLLGASRGRAGASAR